MNKKQQLLQLAEEKVRVGGYSNFSFRELANETGIKSASVHYYFPTKADLGAELAAQYTERFLLALGAPDAPGEHPIYRYIEAFRAALMVDKQMCLCGLFGAESAGLPDKVRLETQVFFERNLVWLTEAWQLARSFDETTARVKAIQTLALLEGAMLMSNATSDSELFESAVSDIIAELK